MSLNNQQERNEKEWVPQGRLVILYLLVDGSDKISSGESTRGADNRRRGVMAPVRWRQLRGGGHVSDSHPGGAGARGVVESRVIQQVTGPLHRAEGQLGNGASGGRLMRCLIRWRQLADVARAETLLQPKGRGQHSAASYQVILLLKPQDLRDISWPTAQLKCCNTNCIISPNMRLS